MIKDDAQNFLATSSVKNFFVNFFVKNFLAFFRDQLTERVLRRPVGINLVICDRAVAQVT
jgi:hypothetical protein